MMFKHLGVVVDVSCIIFFLKSLALDLRKDDFHKLGIFSELPPDHHC